LSLPPCEMATAATRVTLEWLLLSGLGVTMQECTESFLVTTQHLLLPVPEIVLDSFHVERMSAASSQDSGWLLLLLFLRGSVINNVIGLSYPEGIR